MSDVSSTAIQFQLTNDIVLGTEGIDDRLILIGFKPLNNNLIQCYYTVYSSVVVLLLPVGCT